jgi:TnpA family transposase
VQLHQQKGMISLSPPTICNSAVQLARYFHLDERDLAFINQRRGKHNRLGIALQLTTARFLGTFLPDPLQIPSFIRFYIAAQLNISRPEILSRYAERENTRWEHQGLIKLYYDYHDFGDFPGHSD